MCSYRYILLFLICKIASNNEKADRYGSIGLKLICSFKSPGFMVREAYLDFESADLP
jgi:hypothetical protein